MGEPIQKAEYDGDGDTGVKGKTGKDKRLMGLILSIR